MYKKRSRQHPSNSPSPAWIPGAGRGDEYYDGYIDPLPEEIPEGGYFDAPPPGSEAAARCAEAMGRLSSVEEKKGGFYIRNFGADDAELVETLPDGRQTVSPL